VHEKPNQASTPFQRVSLVFRPCLPGRETKSSAIAYFPRLKLADSPAPTGAENYGEDHA
jgi:hypothetical protein